MCKPSYETYREILLHAEVSKQQVAQVCWGFEYEMEKGSNRRAVRSE